MLVTDGSKTQLDFWFAAIAASIKWRIQLLLVPRGGTGAIPADVVAHLQIRYPSINIGATVPYPPVGDSVGVLVTRLNEMARSVVREHVRGDH
jgi:hypothetical protein